MKKAPKSTPKRGTPKSGSSSRQSHAPSVAARAKTAASKPPTRPPPPQPRAAHPAPAAPVPSDLNRQRVYFDKAIGLFHGRQFAEARTIFERAASGPNIEVAHAARLHARMCEQRLAASQPVPSSPDALYDLAITLINRRELGLAEARLNQALLMQESGGHLHYAMALCRGLQGDESAAARHLRRAIELDPKNRTAARNDPDFIELLKSASLRELIFPERKLSV